ncbi:MAG: ribonuclease D [Gammaproteobacteria bacterium]|nr:ribonuclease D [Gammaproteobacteria bacterium]
MADPAPYTFIDTAATLAEYAPELAAADPIALDTEFLRERTYYPKLCLLQFATASGIALVDTIALETLGPIMDLLYADQRVKVLHSGSQDLELFVHMRGATPSSLFDTQIAAAYLGYPDQIGYAGLVEKVLGVTLDKSHTRSDWSRRPLSAAQLGYAVDDVRYLLVMYPLLYQGLEQAGRLTWALEDMVRLEDPERYRVSPALAWMKIKGGQRLSGRAFTALQHLAAWREEEAQRRDLPRGWVVPNDTLLVLAEQRPASPAALAALEGQGTTVPKTFAEPVLTAIAAAGQDPGDAQAGDGPLTDVQKGLLKTLGAHVTRRAGELGLSTALMATRAELEAIVRGGHDARVLTGWRREAVGRELLTLRDAG